jgi:hypothetical protein
MVTKKVVTQELYFFSHEDVVEALKDFLNGDIKTEPGTKVLYGDKPRITAGLSEGSGLTLCFQKIEDV